MVLTPLVDKICDLEYLGTCCENKCYQLYPGTNIWQYTSEVKVIKKNKDLKRTSADKEGLKKKLRTKMWGETMNKEGMRK